METITVLSILAILAGVSFPAYVSYREKSNFDTSVYLVVDSLRHARGLSEANLAGSTWGVKVNEKKAIIFQGDSFSGRDEGKDRKFELPLDLDVGGDSEIVFSQLDGNLPNSKQINLSYDKHSQNININTSGAVDW